MWVSSLGMMYACTPFPPSAAAINFRSSSTLAVGFDGDGASDLWGASTVIAAVRSATLEDACLVGAGRKACKSNSLGAFMYQQV